MKYSLQFVLALAVGLALTVGCNKPENSTDQPDNGDNAADVSPENDEGHGHTHEGDDALIWQREGLEHEGYTIALGHHGKQVLAGHKSEPAVMVTKEGEPVADAKVFVTLLDAAGETVITEETPTVFEPETAEEPAHYAQASVDVPGDASEVTLRYRIELPDAGEFTQDVVVQASKH